MILLISTVSVCSVNGKTILKKRGGKVTKETRDKTSCFPRKLNNILLKISRNFKKPVVIVSGYRSPKDNERRGGAKKSQHIHCKAADFRVPGVSTKRVGKYLAKMKERGGAGFYCRGRFHVDVGPRRSWGGCKAQFVSFSFAGDTESIQDRIGNFEGEIIFEEKEHHHDEINDYDEALFYQNTFDI